MGVITRLDGFNRRHPWSHNDHYGRWILRNLRGVRSGRALDVGCGTGNLIELLRRRFDVVVGVEPDPTTSAAVRARFVHEENVIIDARRIEDFASEAKYDAITVVAALHHLPLDESMKRLRGLLEPGGRLVVVGCYRSTTATDGLLSVLATVCNPVLGVVKHRRVASESLKAMTAPTADPGESMADVRRAAASCLPGSRIRRRLFWRYTLIYDARPAGASVGE
ncbi:MULTISPECIES: class I SAM-dependent methyltransferase [unclassified Rhodococcus (in: high G+C Gram-positive bacteria)]|uniref:class I SAM-dependent methyltransferase n=1 Tax=unclassified Rhodococcus (in: high G+C Gram-positive bacteria) TaxID=192944 RepID=UPI0024B69B75|nr:MULTISPECIES: class I SAM-dependent methyltransferase [unclassified Rhodococcus (in: high G+C Gram-positive bacteria)]MDI9956540.1 class I SAM-dependent methyltransferase [Rhodococcus sp. IEGM 1237]MDI9964050.1 class I SAM-dependent methyltransferase [Rhodococcus sp. IEGM 1251]MDV8124405.1 class I SAM-dependent methyltransferase [Rhodococcus sp. IEGM 1304]